MAARGSWSILNYPPEKAAKMIADGKAYIENLLRPVDVNYKCVAFRGSYLAVAPSPTLFSELAKQNIEIESSITGGLHVDTSDVQCDYTDCDEDFQPFYPQITDARRLSHNKEQVVCAPIFNFTGSRFSSARQIFPSSPPECMRKVRTVLIRRLRRPPAGRRP